jgi:protein TonB
VNAESQRYRFLPLIALAVVVIVAGIGVFWMVRGFLDSAPKPTKQVVQEIHVIRPPPPPPDEPPPPPPPPEEKVDVHEPDQQPDPTPSNEPPPSANLGLDAEGGAGGDAFGLVGHQGGRDLLASGGSAIAWYSGVVSREINDQLSDDQDLRNKGAYTVGFSVWVSADGSIVRFHIIQSTGDKARDKALENAFAHMKPISKPPPADMPQPIKLKIVSRA